MARRNQAAFQNRYDALLTPGEPQSARTPGAVEALIRNPNVRLTSYDNYPGREGSFDFLPADGRLPRV